MSVRITDLPEATELNGSELMPIVQNGVTRRTTLDFVNQAAPAALILQQTQQVLADTQQVLADTQQVKADTNQVLVNTEGVYNQTVMVQGQVEISIADWETQYLGAKSDPPTTDNEGNPLQNGALYWDTSLNAMFVWSGTSWTAFSSAVASVNGQIGEVVLDYADVGAANSGANDNITSMSGVTGDIGSATGLQFDTLTPSPAAVGKLTWNVEDSTLDLGMAGTVVQQIGQEMFYSVQNQTGFPIIDGSVVRAVGTLNTSGRILVAPATADGVYPSHTFMGVVTETIQDGDPGLVTFFGKVRGIDTTGSIYGETWVDGDILYAHPEAAGGLTKVKPQAPNNIVMVALVIKAAVSGTLFVRTTYGSNLRDDELVRLNGLADGDVLQYDADLGRFENRTLSGAGIEPLGAAADLMVAHLAALDPHPQYTTPAEAAAAAPVQSVAGRTGAVTLAKADVGLANVDNTSDVDKPISTATQNALNLKLNSNDPSVTNAREWTAQTVSQVEAEAGTATTRRAWTAERVFQAIAAWWNASAFKTKLDGIQAGAQVNTVTSVAGRTGAVVVSKADVGLGNVTNDAQLKIASNLSDLNSAATARTNLGLGTAATANLGTSGATVPLLSTENTFSNSQEIYNGANYRSIRVRRLDQKAPGIESTATLDVATGSGDARVLSIDLTNNIVRHLRVKNAGGAVVTDSSGAEREILRSDNVTTSSTDTTAGRLLKVGDFGLGALATTDTNADSVSGSGLYRATSGKPSDPNAHLLHISRVASAQGAQMAIEDLPSAAVPRAYVRHRGGDGVWAGWCELYHKGNILGTVSQSAGVPTGAIIERGSNANGEYVRFADGTQICRVRMNSLSGNFVAWSFPAGFIDNKYVATGTSAQSINYLITLDPANSNSLALRAYNSAGSLIATSCAIIAIGRWF